ncbi:MAG TPA: PxKF domain-containing protein [Thermoleophilaceae bacterium]|nr:PxKF domain-containing protein [Thermoleophilaceae bacterium]
MTLGAAPGALAASEQGDAGDLRATAQDLGGASVTEIAGSFPNAVDADLYRVCLSSGASFSASTLGGTTPSNLDTQLFLFAADGRGVYANDDALDTRASRLPANHRFSPATGGVYYLGISPYNHDPQSAQGEIFPSTYTPLQFPDGILNATGMGGEDALAAWDGNWRGTSGSYRIALTGTAACDTTAPTVDLRTPANGARVTRGADVVVDFSCADDGGSGLDSCVGSTADGAKLDTSTLGDVSVTVTARDKAGNQTVVENTVTVVDETAPTAKVDSPLNGGVYARGESVVADYSCADEPGGSGLASCAGPVAQGGAVDTSTLGEKSFVVHAKDKAGNEGSATATYTVVDRTRPTIALLAPAADAVYALGEQVDADYSCADEEGGSGIATCAGTVADGASVDTASVGKKTFTVNATDAAENPASISVTYTVVDRTPPSVAVSAPVDGAVYVLGQRVLAAYSCADQPGGSGVATCEGPVANGAAIDTATVGAHSFEVRTADNAGNAGSRTVSYSVVYDFHGFFSPVQNPPKWTRWKAGAPVPVRFSLGGYSGPSPEAVGYPRSRPCGGGVGELVTRAAQKTPVFDYERRSGRYSLRWKTDRRWAGTCREFVLKLDDGSVHTARFQFTKRGHDDRGDE